MTSKEQLQKELVLSRRKITDAEEKKTKLKNIVQDLDNLYQTSKGSVMRYSKLKTIVKEFTSENTMKLLQDCTRKKPPLNGRAASISGSLLQRCAEFAGKAAEVAEKNTDLTDVHVIPPEIKKMDKKTLSMNIENNKKILADYQQSFINFKNRIEQLRKTYEASKAHPPNIRYQELKNMIKEMVRTGV